jgi:hypothetical protein
MENIQIDQETAEQKFIRWYAANGHVERYEVSAASAVLLLVLVWQ